MAAPRVRTVAGIAVLVLATLWMALPTRLGGATTYVTTYGISMEPSFHAGDLAVVRTTDTYRVGDVAAYLSPRLKAVVLHRIVAVEPDGYVFKGDNNTWLDPEKPGRDALLGRLVLHVPQGGAWLRRISSPLAVGAAALLLAGLAGETGRRRVRRRRRQGSGGAVHSADGGSRIPAMTALALAVATGVTATGLLVALSPVEAVEAAADTVAPVAQPSSPVAQPSSPAAQPSSPAALPSSPSLPGPRPRTVDFSYTATVPRTAAYDATTVVAPDPVFRRLADRVVLRVRYSGGPATLAVRLRMSTVVGWRSTVDLVPATPVGAGRQEVTAILDLASLWGRAEAASVYTGVQVSGVDLEVQADVRSPGLEPWTPSTRLALNTLVLAVPDGDKALHARWDPPAPPPVAPPPGVTVLGRSVPWTALRTGGIVLVLLAVLLAPAAWWARRRWAAIGEDARIRRRYGDLLATVTRPPEPPDRPVVDVTRFSTLARLARRYGLLVLHWTNPVGGTTYVVWDDRTVYRYVVAPSPPRRAPTHRRSARHGPEPAASQRREPPQPMRRSRVPEQRRPPQPDRTSASPRRIPPAGRTPARGRTSTPTSAVRPQARHAVRPGLLGAPVAAAACLAREVLAASDPMPDRPTHRHATGIVRRPRVLPPSAATPVPPPATGRFPADWRLDGPIPTVPGPPRRATDSRSR